MMRTVLMDSHKRGAPLRQAGGGGGCPRMNVTPSQFLADGSKLPGSIFKPIGS